MIKYLLDTNICIYVIKQKPLEVIHHFQSLTVSEVGISSITLSELEYGVSKSTRVAQNKLALAQFLASIEILPYDDLAAREYGAIRARLEQLGTPIGALDTLIGAHALAMNCILVTNNEKEFARIPCLLLDTLSA